MGLLFLLFIFLFQAQAACAADSMLVLDQTDSIYGHLSVYLWENGVRMERRNGDYCFLCIGPSWDILLFSDKTKKIFRYPFARWSKKGFMTALSLQDNDSYYTNNVIKKGTLIIAGSSCDRFVYPYKKVRRNGIKADLLVYQEWKGADKPKRAVCAVYDVPFLGGIPFQFRRPATMGFGRANYTGESIRAVLKTDSVRVTPVKKALFQPPQNYKPASDSEVVLPQGFDEKSFLYDVMK